MSHDKNYWKKRQEELFLQGEKSIEEYYTELKKAFEQAQKEIQFVINDFYAQYATENRISYTEAQKRLNKAQIGKLKDYISKVNATMGTYNMELRNMSIKARITRYEALQMQIDAILQYLYSIDYEIKGAKSFMYIYEDNYRQMWYNFDIYTGFHHEFAQIVPSDIEQLIAYPFNGQNFSERLWKQKDYLQSKLKEALTTVLVSGEDPARLSKDFAKCFKAREYEAYRLLHTETSFVLEQSTLSSYKESGVAQYRILATLDNRTSEICREQDGKIYKVEDAMVGTNYPPFHMFCRTTTVPDYEEVPEGVRMARDSTGKAIEVPADMTYPEWKEKYLDNSKESAIIKVLKDNDIKGVPIFDVKPIDLTGYSFDDAHINHERKHHVTRQEAESFMNGALIALERWNGRFINYYSENGSVYIDIQKKEIRTAFKKDEYDKETIALIEEAKKYDS